MINHPSTINPLHQKQTSNKVIGSKHLYTLPTPINVYKLANYLTGYDSDRDQFLLNGFRSGFNLEFEGKRGYQFSLNLKSALENKEVVNDKIFKELQAGRIQGPFSDPPIPSIKIYPLCIVPKKSPGQFRIIHHLSFPDKKEGSVNAGISDEAASVHYSGINDAILCIQDIGDTAFCCKTYIRSAFRILPVAPEDYELLGFYWEGNTILINVCRWDVGLVAKY